VPKSGLLTWGPYRGGGKGWQLSPCRLAMMGGSAGPCGVVKGGLGEGLSRGAKTILWRLGGPTRSAQGTASNFPDGKRVFNLPSVIQEVNRLPRF